jgi:aminodeoxyfutalosine deaminase
MDAQDAVEGARRAIAFRDRGVVGLGIGGQEGKCPPQTYAKAFAVARDGGLGCVPHAGEGAGAESVRATLESLAPVRIRHGIRAVEDPSLVRELADRGIVLDVCPTSNLRTQVVASLAEHPLPALLAAGVACSVNTDDPAMFGTDLGQEYALLPRMGVDPRPVYQAAARGALCDDATRRRITEVGERTPWPA